MSPAPVLHGYVCQFCGNESIETPWDEKDFHCSQELGGCGATIKGPLPPVGSIIFGNDLSDRSLYPDAKEISAEGYTRGGQK